MLRVIALEERRRRNTEASKSNVLRSEGATK